MQEPSSDVAQAMHRLADEIHALRMELTPSLRKTEALQDQEAARKLRLINLKKKAAANAGGHSNGNCNSENR